jgi:hypothetical protein
MERDLARASSAHKKEEGRSSFLKKRSKKLLSVQVRTEVAVSDRGEGAGVKVFWFFFSKKNISSFTQT